MTPLTALGRALIPSDVQRSLSTILRNGSRLSNSQVLRDRYSSHAWKIGVCVSGGPDSMALAFLLNNMPAAWNVCVKPLAWIVDHQARAGSHQEALRVQEYLREINVESEILQMSWDVDRPLNLPNFESRAREKRYRLIARAALRHGIRHIFLGHHQDDQIETVLMRLCRGVRPDLTSLIGMSEVSPIPCCDDIYGACEDETAFSDSTGPHQEETVSRLQSDMTMENLRPRNGSYSIPSESSGIAVCRPLLDFHKADLVATCKENGVRYVTDATNSDPTFTLRNAVRYMRTNHQLPRALKSQRLLALSRSAHDTFSYYKLYGRSLFRKFNFHHLDLASGTAVVQVPSLELEDLQSRRGASHAVSLLTEIFTPLERDKQLHQAPSKVVAALLTKPAVRFTDDARGTISFNHHSVMFELKDAADNIWMLSRQPMRRSEIENNTSCFDVHDGGLRDLHSWPKLKDGLTTKWKLWDNRFWIRLDVANNPDVLARIKIAPLTPENLRNFRTSIIHLENAIGKGLLTELEEELNRIAPGKSRFTLPVLTYDDKVISFPTVGFTGSRLMTEILVPTLDIGIHVRYKAINNIEHLKITSEMDDNRAAGGGCTALPAKLNIEPENHPAS